MPIFWADLISIFFILIILLSSIISIPIFIIYFIKTKNSIKNYLVFKKRYLILLLPFAICITTSAIRKVNVPLNITEKMISSQNGTYELYQQMWTVMPPNEIIDPRISIQFFLLNKKNNIIVKGDPIILFESSDYVEPNVSWQNNYVSISNFNHRKPKNKVTLKYEL